MSVYLVFIIFVLCLSSLIWCLRYLYISYKAIRHHKRELERRAAVADPETMKKYKFDVFIHEEAFALNEAEFSEQIRQALKERKQTKD
jgi:hypothetical protein